MHHLNLDTLQLAKGSHSDGPPPDDPNCELCLFEAYNLLTKPPGQPAEITDDCPPDVSRVLHTFGLRLNDVLPDDRRQKLKQFLPRDGVSPLAGTRDDGLDEARSYLALDWLVRTWTPAWLDLAGLSAEATALRDLRRIVDMLAAQAAGPVVRIAHEKAAAAWDAAADAAGDAAGDAAWAAAWAAAWDAAGDAAAAAARDAAAAAAGDAAADAAWDAARDAARERLQPTVDQLQTSAIDLYTRMIRPQGPIDHV